jgi:lysine-N-methylase
MELCFPEDLDQFHCLASDCPRSCCIGWEVVVDDDTAAYYDTVPGPLGGELRASLTWKDGERCFVQRGRRCPFLDRENLCRIHRELGEEHTSAVCRSHPRFLEDYGALREISLSASCPAVAELLLARRDPLEFVRRETGEPDAPWTDEWLPYLLVCRERAFSIVRDRASPVRRRMLWLLLFCNAAQELLDEGRPEALPGFCGEWGELPDALPEGLPVSGAGIFPYAWRVLEKLEVLEPDWLPLLKAAESGDGNTALPDWAEERVLSYFLFRYFLKSVADGDLLSRAQLAVFVTLTVGRLSARTAAPQEALYRCCRELEHSGENLAALQAAFCGDPGLALGRFFRELEAH